MTTSEPRPLPRRTLSTGRLLIGAGAGVLAVGALWLAFTLAGEPDTAAGALVGGGGVIVLMAVVRWRAARQGTATSGFGRALLGTADERDRTISSSSLAYVGIAAFLANAFGLAAVALGADGAMVIGAIEWFLLAVLVGSSMVLSRRL